MKNIFIALLATTAFLASTSANAYFANIINLFGVNPKHDAESEYRLLLLGKSIVETRLADAEVSIALKSMYGAGNTKFSSGNELMSNVNDKLIVAYDSWLNVGYNIKTIREWAFSKYREDYAEAFCQIISDASSFVTIMNERRTDADYLMSRYDAISKNCQAADNPARAIDLSLGNLEDQALEAAETILLFKTELSSVISRSESFVEDAGIYGHIYERLALNGAKPEILNLDEKVFIAVTNFYLQYEALEQVSREAHTLSIGGHGPEIERFDGKWTGSEN